MPPKKKVRESPKKAPDPMEVDDESEEGQNGDQAQVSLASRGFRPEAKDKLYNDFVENEDVCYPASLAAGEMTRQTMTIVDTLWYIDGSHDKINARITDSSKKIPARFGKYTGYNEFKRKRKAAPQITSAQLNRHADVLFRLSTSNTARAWRDFAQQLQGLAVSLQTYAAYLENSNDKQKFRQSLSHPVRQYGDYGTVLCHPKCHGPVKPCYGKLDQVISECDEYTPVFFDEHIHTSEVFKDKYQRRRFLDGISLTYSVDVLSYDPGAGLGKVVFLWRVPDDRSPTEMMSSAAKVHQTLEDKLPQYHTREMRREFTGTYQGMANIPPHIMRAIYSDLTLDATSAQNPALDARVRCAISSDDPDIAIDLRACNKGRPNETFDVFFEEIQKEVDSMTATDERRHGDIQHFSKFISVRDLIEQTSKKCPEGTPIPSESTVLFAFVPKNSYRNTSKLYKGRIQLQHKVQSRQLRSEHIDEHYCAAIFKYMKQYAVKYRDQTVMVCMDDKSKVDFGEPGMAISSGVRGKKSIVPVGCTLAALDHDLGSKGSLTPSVCLHIDIPENVSESFYRGQVHVTLKDSVFQPSTPFRHATELQQILKPETDDEPHPYLLLFTDGGPDHRVTYGAVKCSLIILFKQLNLDILIAARTAPGHSWLNPAERIMSLLNIAFQNVALHRAEMNSMFEQMLRACSTVNEIRKKAEKEDGLEPAWLKAVEPMIIQLKERIERVQLKGKTFTSGEPATKQQAVDYESKVLRLVDPEITVGQYTKNHLKSKEMYNDFIERHCRERNYIFQVRKCNVETCCAPIRNPSGVVPPFLPDPELNPEDEGHYKSFMDLLGTETTERAMPSGQTASAAKVAEEQQGCPNRLLVAQNVRMTVKCYECGKPRCIYSKKALTVREERGLRRLLDRYQYTCGSIITPDDYGEIEVPPAPETVATYDINGPRLMITKIVNENFKSYAGVRALGPFHKSFTSIVGPNGSGKSNVIDSMLFVFGYRASKVRLKKLGGLIHNSENHLNIGSCTVTVYFQKIIDTGAGEDDYTVVPDSEFNVSRTAFKDNSSVYSINGKRSTYKEVATLLRRSGIDLDHNRFLILQGEVEQIAMMKPKGQSDHDDGMLEFLEDIIGSNRFKEPIEVLAKRVETLNELRGEKMNRVKAVEKDKDDLEEAKNEAVEFLTLENNIVKLKNKLYQKYISSCVKNEEKAKTEYDKVNSGMEEFNQKMQEISNGRQEKAKKQKKILKAFDDLTKQCEEGKEKFSECEKADVKLREDLKHAKSNSKKLEKSTEQEKKKIEELKEVPEQAQKSIDELNKKQERLEKEKQKEEVKLKEVMDSLKTETQGLQDEKDKKEEKLLGLQKSVNEKKSKLEVSQSELDLYLSNQTQETNKLNDMTKKLEKTKENLKEKKKTVSDLEGKLPDLQNALEKSEGDLQNTSKREAELIEEVRSLRRKVEEVRSSMEANRSQSKVVDFIMNLKSSGTLPGVYGRLGDLGGIDEKFDVAISTACGALDNIVVDSMDTAQKCVEFLKKNNVGSATFIGLDKMARWKEHASRTIKTPENVHRLFDLVKVSDGKMKPAFYFALRDTLVANDLDQATRIAYGGQRFRVVTLQGQLIDTSGTMSGGGKTVCRGKMGSKVVSKDVDTKDLANNETKLKKLTDEGQQCRANKERLEDFIKQQKKDIAHVQHSLQKAGIEIKALTEQVESLEAQIVDQEKKVEAAAPDEKELKQLEKTVAEYRKDYQKVADVTGKLEAEVQELHNQIMDIGGSKMNAAQSRVNAIQSQIDQTVGQITKATVGVKTSERNLKKAEEKLKNIHDEIEENKENLKQLEAKLTELEEEATKVMEAYQESQDTMKAAETALNDINKELAKLEEEENRIQKDVIDVRNELEKYQTIMKENQAKVKHWKKELSHLALTPIDTQEAETLTTIPEEEIEAIKKDETQYEITVLEERLTQMKPNMAAIAEYRKKEELYLQRVAELDQITDFRDNQRKYHEELRKQRLDEFMAGFSVITYKLKEMYQMITLGGDAELELVDSLDPFAEGIVFSVRPPKKSWKNISNLSGGEKTLSSLALVFALHHYKPTPLYVMDEIDAALDFKNVSIVANYIKERTKNAQFIIISLRNNMFELADRLVGIYKTDNCTKSVTINPNKLSIPLQEVDPNAA